MTARQRLASLQAIIASAPADAAASYGEALGALEAYDQSRRTREQRLADEITQLTADGRPEAYEVWTHPSWQRWTPEFHIPDELRIATLQHGPLAGLPGTLPMFTGAAIVLATETESDAAPAREAMRSLVVRAAAAMGPSAVLHLIDPLQEGHGFPERQHLPTAAPRSTDVARDLKAAFEAAQADLGPDGSGRRHVVVAMDYPRGYDHAAVGYLNRLPRLAGVQLVLHHSMDGRAQVTSQLELTRPIVVSIDPDGVATGPWGRQRGHLDGVPEATLVQRVGAAIPRTTGPTEVNWQYLNSCGPWHGTARRAAVATIGLTTKGEPINLIFGRDETDQMLSHLVIGGTSGSGKSVLLHNLICALATRYAPDEVQFILVDGRDGAEMTAYSTLPHAQAVAVRTPRELAESIILDVQAELTRRNGILVSYGVQGIEQLPNAACGGLARLVVVIDEYQVYLQSHRGEVENALVDVAARGRAVGIHLVLASQRFNASGMANPRALFANVHTRVAFKMPPSEVATITEFDAAGRELIRSHCVGAGDVVVSRNQGGAPHEVGKASWISGDDVNRLVAQLAARDARRPLVLDGAASPDAAENPALRALADVGADAIDSWAEASPADGGLGAIRWPGDAAAFIAGRTLSLWGSAYAQLTRAAKQNVAVFAEHPEVLTGVLQSGLTSWSRTTQPRGFRAWVLARVPARAVDPWRGALTDQLAGLLAMAGHGHRQAETGADAVAMLAEAVELLGQRAQLSVDARVDADTVVLVAAGLEHLPEFQVIDGRYGPEPSPAMASLLRVAKEGPMLGIHVVLGVSSRESWLQLCSDKDLNLFRHRFYGQMSAADSHKLFGNQHATGVNGASALAGPPRLGYTDATADEPVRLLPYTSGPRLLAALAELGRRTP